jgi:hypothetical protein
VVCFCFGHAFPCLLVLYFVATVFSLILSLFHSALYRLQLRSPRQNFLVFSLFLFFEGQVRAKFAFETDPKLIGTILESSVSAVVNFLPMRLQEAESNLFFDMLLEMLQRATDPQLQIVLTDNCISMATSATSVAKLIPFLAADAKVSGTYVLGQRQRWRVVIRAMAFAVPEAATLLQVEESRDKSDDGVRSSMTAKSSAPDAGVKRAAWDRWHSSAAESLSRYQLAAGVFVCLCAYVCMCVCVCVCVCVYVAGTDALCF